jgi:hypothetical protein
MTESQTALASYSNSQPLNDPFINAITLSGTSGSTSGTNTFATKETGEPSHANLANATNSVWWKWTAPTTGIVRFDTLLTSFDTVMAAYTGSAVNALTEIASNDDYSISNLQSIVSFPTVSNTTYSIAVAGYNGTNGTIKLDWIFIPSGSIRTLTNGISVPGLTGSLYSSAYFKIAVPTGASNLVVTTAGGLTGQDCDLFVMYKAPPTIDLYDHVSGGATCTESASNPTPTPGDWYIMIDGYTAYSSVTLKASYRQNIPVITTASLSSSSGSTYLNMQFDANAGKIYNIQRKYALTNLNWTTIRTFTTNANQRVTLPITLTPGQPAGFYRLQMP